MRKSIEQLKAEQTLAMMIRNSTLEKALKNVRTMTSYWRYAIAQRVTLGIFLALLFDIYDDFDKQMMLNVYQQYQEYHERFQKGDENIYKQMMAVDQLLDGQLMKEELFDAIKQKAEEDNE